MLNCVAEDRGLGDAGDARRPAREPDPVVGHDADDLAEAERHDGEVVAAHAQRRVADEHPGEGGQQPADDEVDPRQPPVGVDVDAELHLEDLVEDDRRVVGADGVEGHVAEVEQPGEADDDVQARGEHDVDHDDGHQRDPAVGPDQERQDTAMARSTASRIRWDLRGCRLPTRAAAIGIELRAAARPRRPAVGRRRCRLAGHARPSARRWSRAGRTAGTTGSGSG